MDNPGLGLFLDFLGLFLLVAELLLFLIKVFLFNKLGHIIARFYIATILVISSVFGAAIEFVTSYILLLYPFVSRTRGYPFTKTSNMEGEFYLPEFLFRTSRCHNKRKNISLEKYFLYDI
jgi:hypothetical protein